MQLSETASRLKQVYKATPIYLQSTYHKNRRADGLDKNDKAEAIDII